MSELTNNTSSAAAFKWQLLASVSAVTLAALFPAAALASDEGKPSVWIDLGVQLDRLTNGQDPYLPPFVPAMLENPFAPPGEVQKSPRYAFGQEGRLTFTPEDSNWRFSAALRFGRSNRGTKAHDESTVYTSPELIRSVPALGKYLIDPYPISRQVAGSTSSQRHESYLILDFTAGKDVGLGLFGSHGSSVLNAGVRFAQFASRSKTRIDALPGVGISYKYLSTLGGLPAYIKIPSSYWNIYAAKMDAKRSFAGVGPSLSWDGNATLLGNEDSSEVTFDWGLNGALLFGRQKVSIHQTAMAHHVTRFNISGAMPTLYPTKIHNADRSRSVVVPNVGGFAGMSLRFPNAKVSFGYRIDAFFGAMDGGIDARTTYDRNFYGPFATISIGLGG
jgi:hypothetical protein